MRNLRFVVPFTFAALIISTFASSAKAEEEPKKLVAMVTLSSVDDLFKFADKFGATIENPGLAPMLTMGVTMATQGKGLTAIDKSAPIAIAAFADDKKSNPPFVIYVAGKSVKDIYGLLPKPQGKLEKATEKDGVLSGPAFNGRSFYLAKKGNWVLVTDKKYLLNVAPEDPTEAMGEAPKKYLVGLRVLLKDLSSEERESVIAGAKVVLQSIPGESTTFAPIAVSIRDRLTEMTTKLNSLDDLTIGVQFDEAEKKLVVEATATAKGGTDLSGDISTIRSLKTDYAGFLSSDFAVGAIRRGVAEEVNSEKKKANAPPRPAFGEGFAFVDALIEQTHAGGRINDGFGFKCEPNDSYLIYGAQIGDSGKLESRFKRAAEACKKEAPQIITDLKFDVATAKEMKIHKLSLTVPKGAGPSGVFPEKVELVAAFGEGKVYFCVGEKAEELLKSRIDSSESADVAAIPSMKIQVKTEPIVKMLQATTPNPFTALLSEKLARSSGKDGVILSGDAKESDSYVLRLEVEEGVLKAIGSSASMSGPPASRTPSQSGGPEKSPFAD